MTDYTITTNFGAKDSLPSGNAGKVIKGSEFTTEFTNIQTAVNTKADTAGDTFTGVVNFSADVAVNTNTLFVDVSEAKVGIGTTSPQAPLHVHGDINLGNNAGADAADVEIASLNFYNRDTSGSAPNNAAIIRAYSHSATGSGGYLTFATSFGGEAEGADATEKMRIDSSGNVLVGKTADAFNTVGVELLPTGRVYATATSTAPMYSNRKSTDGSIMDFAKDGTTVGSIGSRGGTALFIESAGTTGTAGLGIDVAIAPRNNGALSDGEIDLGTSAYRFQDIYRSGSTYSTSDRNKKQDIRDLTDAETRVAIVAKGSLKAFRYIDSVEAEGDEANIHFGIMAQELKAAFEAEGLNANDYQVFKTSTYTDDDGVEQTTYSICYENLLAFIIAAI